MNTKELIDEAISLPIDKRVLVVDSLLPSLNQPESEIDRKWNEVAQKRLMEMRAGKIESISGEQVFKKIWGKQARHATSQHSGTPVTNIHSPTQRMGDALVALRPSQLRTKPCSVKTTSNGWTAIRNAIIASLARY
ncbi:hypothetical protein BMR05_01955 [Methylococcaceae bacterium HT4]|nr:hypothetical protein BMR05_01955 [Methylococcaceae bacterium HT4]